MGKRGAMPLANAITGSGGLTFRLGTGRAPT
jgi:hypothetical protein